MKLQTLALLTSTLLLAPLAIAANVDATYLPAQGKVLLPNLKIGNLTYFAVLKKLPNANDFRLDPTSLINLTAPLNYTPAKPAELVGSFIPPDEPATLLTFKADGTYILIQGPTTDTNCVAAGGPETGTYQYEPTTGVLVAQTLTDSNGECGLSHPRGALRFKKVGADLIAMVREDGQNIELKLTPKL
jgi:hypothetical protein